MDNTVRVKFWLELPGGTDEDYAEFDRAEWEAWTPEQREGAMDESARTALFNKVGYGYDTEPTDD